MDIQSLLFLYLIIILSSIVHEYAHAWAAFRQGDLTAKYAGRLTLNPISHMDLWGTVILPLALLLSPIHVFFGYAKPVPINPYNFRDQRRGMTYVSLAGVGANFLVAILLGIITKFIPVQISIKTAIINAISSGYLVSPNSSDFFTNIFIFICAVIFINIWLGLFNLLPFPPLDGSKLLIALADINTSRYSRVIEFLSQPVGIIIAIFVAMTFLPYVSNFLLKLIVG